jgi:Flp pilus assembly protein TadG
VELGFSLPFLMIFIVGIADFGTAFNIKQKISNAAREGARAGISQTYNDLSDTPPASVTSIKNTVVNYLTNAGLTACTFGAVTSSGAMQWTSSPNANCAIKIERQNATATSGGTKLVATQVTVTYPVTWTFNRIIGLLKSGASPSLPANLSSAAFMENIQ